VCAARATLRPDALGAAGDFSPLPHSSLIKSTVETSNGRGRPRCAAEFEAEQDDRVAASADILPDKSEEPAGWIVPLPEGASVDPAGGWLARTTSSIVVAAARSESPPAL
jgi:hypothetical protein